jgi:small ligand-binding sensory domain FIST
MGVQIGCGLSTAPDAAAAAAQAAATARAGLGGAEADLVLVFVAGTHVTAAEAALEAVHAELAPGALVGCGAGGVLAEGREVERSTGLVVWAANLDTGAASTFHAEAHELEETIAVVGVPELDGASAIILLPDATTFPAEGILAELATRAPGVPVLGGLPSARTVDGGVLMLDDEVLHAGAVGVRLDNVELLPCVSQGAAPLGPQLTVTAAHGHVIEELDGRPALAAIHDAINGLDVADRGMLAQGLLVGIVLNDGGVDAGQQQYLVRGVLGGDSGAGTLAVGAAVESGQVVRLHARDAVSADRDLRDALALRRAALGGAPPAGALMFTCTGRGRGMFGIRDHDAALVADALSDVPAAGFFAAGEIGPVGGANFVHSFTATLALFAQ